MAVEPHPWDETRAANRQGDGEPPEPAGSDDGETAGTVGDGTGTRRSGIGGKRRPKALTVLAAVVLALFALWGIGGPLLGTSTLTATNEMVSSGPYPEAGFAETQTTNTYLDDTYTAELPATILFYDSLKNGHYTQWNPYISGGTPLAAIPDQAFFSPLSLPYFVMPAWLAPAYERLLIVICSAGGCFLFLRRLRLSRASSITGGLIYAGSGFMVAWLGFPQTRTAAFIPVLFWALERFVQERRIRDGVLIAVPMAAMLLGGFPAVTGFALITAVPYVLVRIFAEHRAELRRAVKLALGAAGGALLGVGLAAFQLLPFMDFYKSQWIVARGQDSKAHLDPATLLTAIAPWALGTSNPTRNPQYILSPNIVESITYIGAAAAVLVLVAIAVPWRARTLLPRAVWVFLALATLGWGLLMFVGGWPLGALQHLPALRSLFASNYVGRARGVFGFLLAALAATGFELLMLNRERLIGANRRRLVWASGVGLGTAALALVLVRFGWHDSKAAELIPGVGKVLGPYKRQLLEAGVLLAATAVCVLLLRYGDRIRRPLGGRTARFAAAATIILLVGGQNLAFVVRYYPHSTKSTFYPATDTHQYLAANLGEQRYASTFTGMVLGTNSAYDLRSVNGHTFIDNSFAALINSIPNDPTPSTTYIDFKADAAEATSPVLDLLGTKYFVSSLTDPVFGTAVNAPTDGTTVLLSPGQSVTVQVPGSGPLRGVGFMPTGTVTGTLGGAHQDSYVDVAVHDPSGTEVAHSKRLTEGMASGAEYTVPVAADGVPAGTQLTATITLHSAASVAAAANGGALALSTVTDADDGLKMVHVGTSAIYQRMNAQPRIRWASQAQVVTDQSSRLKALSSGSVPADSVVLSSPGPAAAGQPATVTVADDGTDTIRTSVNAQGAGYLVVADADQKGWSASVDGKHADLVAADQGLVAVPVPAGDHVVALRFTMPRHGIGYWISAFCVLLAAGLLGCEWWLARRRREADRGPTG